MKRRYLLLALLLVGLVVIRVSTWRSSAPVDDHVLLPPDNCPYELPPPDGYTHELPPPDGGEHLLGTVPVEGRESRSGRSCNI